MKGISFIITSDPGNYHD